MFYQFPVIKHINDVLPHINENFKVYEKEDYVVVTYLLAGNETFPTILPIHRFDAIPDIDRAAFRRECRGLIFDKSGKLIRRSYHKFFNHGEREETLNQNIDWTIPHIFLEKLDGSMVTPLPLGSHIRWATKAGITDVSMQAEVFVATRLWYQEFAKVCLKEDWLPIFEWCSRQNRIVIDYPEENLILTGMRRQTTGEYMDIVTLRANALYHNIPLVNKFDTPEYLEIISEMDNCEGVVIRFENGHMLKIKTSTYLQIHRAKEHLIHEKRIIEMLLNNKLDDVLPYLPEADKQAILSYSKDFLDGLIKVIADIKATRTNWVQSRKEFALNKEISPLYKSIIFSCWDNPEKIEEEMLNKIEKNLGSQPMVDKVRPLWDNRATWEYRGIVE